MAKILVVDDSSIARKFIKRILQNTQHEVIGEAENGEQAIEQYKNTSPDLVTMDIDMPVMDGIEASNSILQYDSQARIILVTAHEHNDLTVQAQENNIKYFINKPVTEPALLGQIDRIFTDFPIVNQGLDQHAAEEPIPQTTTEVLNHLNSHPKVKKDQVVVIEHYSGSSNLQGIVVAATEELFIIRITKPLILNGFNDIDPVIIGHKHNENLCLYSCWVKSISTTDKTIELMIEKEEDLSNAQNIDSIPASLHIEVKDSALHKKHTCAVKRFNGYGMTIISKVSYNIGENIDFDLYILKNIFLLKARVNEMRNTIQGSEYDITFIQSGLDTYKQLRKHMEFILQGYEKSIDALNQ